MKTWRELEAEGVKRCCAMFTSGKRCRRRTVAPFESSWCAKHGPIIEAECARAIKAMNAPPPRNTEEDDD